ncbi:anti-sigma factor family protein [Streptomyces seoulensis]|uniref:anti-sigma factor family protein n=1 Tax=Streptomyces seoulensis TaxID=73044 RepID=UPI001FCB081E|nr:zf-HC2 domain-containing protein [Streptomyces seoulensis]BDH07965.1 membrane protein [Streptomyces seoulensis]
MSGTGPNPAEAHLAEQHLGDRLSALVDGELGHDSRDRVLAHLATCCRCRAEADAQRRLKNVFAEAAPPPPSESFLARLQGLPGGDADGPTSPGGSFGRGSGEGVFGVGDGERFAFGYVPAASAHAPEQRGFRIHPVADRPSSRGLRFAAAAAGAVSLAAVALGGVTTALPGDLSADARGGSGAGSNVAPSRSAGTGTGTGAGTGTAAPDNQRRRSAAPLLAQGGGAPDRTPAAPVSASAPLLPGIAAPVDARVQDTARDLAMPVMAGAAAVSPLIRPLGETTPFSLDSWPLAPQAAGTTVAAAPTNSPSSSAP